MYGGKTIETTSRYVYIGSLLLPMKEVLLAVPRRNLVQPRRLQAAHQPALSGDILIAIVGLCIVALCARHSLSRVHFVLCLYATWGIKTAPA
jgi:hypothetical protein